MEGIVSHISLTLQCLSNAAPLGLLMIDDNVKKKNLLENLYLKKEVLFKLVHGHNLNHFVI